MPSRDGAKPAVLRCGTMGEPEFGMGGLIQLAKKIAVPKFQWTLPLPRGDYKIIVVRQPAVKAAEMADAVRWSLGSVLEYPVQEASVDWMPIPTGNYAPERQEHLYAVVAQNEVIQQKVGVFQQAKVILNAVDVRESAQRNIATLLAKPGEALGMLSVSAQGVLITVTFEGSLYLDRFIEASLASAVAGDDESRTRLFERISLQVQRSLDFVSRTLPFMTIDRIVLGPLPAPIALREYLSQSITVPVETLDLANLFDLSLTPELTTEENQARYFVALGAALRGMETSQ
jgi:MSHA biogenesis protein MshI